ncbi:MAG: hypothetical protein ABIT09_08350 [Croceibacterium sp.]
MPAVLVYPAPLGDQIRVPPAGLRMAGLPSVLLNHGTADAVVPVAALHRAKSDLRYLALT